VASVQPTGMKAETIGSTVLAHSRSILHLLLSLQPHTSVLYIFCTRSFQAFLFLTIWLQFLSICSFKSFITSSVHLFFDRPSFLTPVRLQSATFFKPYRGKLLVCLTAIEGRMYLSSQFFAEGTITHFITILFCACVVNLLAPELLLFFKF